MKKKYWYALLFFIGSFIILLLIYPLKKTINFNNIFYQNSGIENLKRSTLKETPHILNKNEIYEQINNLLLSGKQIKEVVRPPFFYLPNDIDRVQIDMKPRYYKLGNLYFSLVIRSNMNMPIRSHGSFAGILIARESKDDFWQKFIKIKNLNNSINNPMYLWSENKKLFLTVVDSNGAGSGEGILKLISSGDFGKNWNLKECYYSSFDDEVCNKGSKKDLNSQMCSQNKLNLNEEKPDGSCFNLDLNFN